MGGRARGRGLLAGRVAGRAYVGADADPAGRVGGHECKPSGSHSWRNHFEAKKTPATKAFSTTYWFSCINTCTVQRARNKDIPSGIRRENSLPNIQVASFGDPAAQFWRYRIHSKFLLHRAG